MFCLAWIVLNVSSRALVMSFLSGVTDVFFRQIVCVGAHKLNVSREPLLLAIAPHSNQFLDPMIVMKTFERPIGWLCAAKSMRYKRSLQDIVAFFARSLGAVPVERPQDLAKVGKGRLSRIDQRVRVFGEGTRFTEQCKVGDQLVVTSGVSVGSVSAKIASVVSDSALVLAEPGGFRFGDESEADCEAIGGAGYKVQPKLNHHEMYDAVYERLSQGGVVGIFPEGGSHDRASLLPLKSGIAVMALGACDKYGEPLRTKLKIAAVGLNYFSGHRFRSRVFVDYGEAFEVDYRLVELYRDPRTKRAAADELMAQILTAVKAVTVQAPNHNTQELLYMLRRLYVADDARDMSLDRKVAITRALARCFIDTGDRDLPQVKALLDRVAVYNETLKQLRIHDRRVSLGETIEAMDALAILSLRSSVLAFYAIALVPGILLASPLLLLAEVISRHKAKAAVAGSRVKLQGKDVLGTWKVLVGMVVIPVLHVAYTAVIYWATAYKHAVAYFFFMPFVSATSIIASESALATARSLGPLWMILVDNDRGLALRRMRRQLQADVRHLAQTLGWDEIITKSTSRADLTFNSAHNDGDAAGTGGEQVSNAAALPGAS